MRLKEKWKDFCCKVLYCFKPVAVILACFIFMIIINAICITFLCFVTDEVLGDILIAILTGVTASGFVAVIIEMVNNYQRNEKRWLQLSRLFGALTHYEQEIEVATGRLPIKKAHLDFMKKLHKEMVLDGNETQEEANQALNEAAALDTDDPEGDAQFRDRVCCVFNKLPELIPLLEDAYRNHSTDFRRSELELMYLILEDHRQIVHMISLRLMEQSSLLFGKDPKNPGDLVEWLPKRLKKDLGPGMLFHLAEDVWDTERKHIAEILMRQGSLSLESLEITIGEHLLKEDAPDEQTDNTDRDAENDNAFGKIISHLIHEMDGELLKLQKIIKAEPGLHTIFTYFQNYSSQNRD